MEISLKRNYGYSLIFKAENVNVEEDIEERIYTKGPDGKIDFSIPPVRDISDSSVSQIATLLDDMIYYRKKDFNSVSLIENLFEKLPSELVSSLLKRLNDNYSE